MNTDVLGILSSVMQDPGAMEKVMSMASMLSSSKAADAILTQNGEPPQSRDTNEDANLKNILSSLSSLSSQSLPQTPSTESAVGNVTMSQRLALLCAIRPYLSSDKAQKLDGVIRILKLVSTLEKSGIKLF